MGALWIRSILESRERANGGGVTASALRVLMGVAFVAAIVAVVSAALSLATSHPSD